MEEKGSIEIGGENVKWKKLLHRSLTSSELNQLKEDLESMAADCEFIYTLSLYHQNDEVKKLLYGLGFTIAKFENRILSLIVEFYDVETLIRFINEGFCLTDIKINRMIKRYDNIGYEISKGFIDYFDKIKRDNELIQKILKVKKHFKDKDSTEDAN